MNEYIMLQNIRDSSNVFGIVVAENQKCFVIHNMKIDTIICQALFVIDKI